MDNDLLSIQQARDLAVAARAAQRQFLHASQAEVDRICAAMAEAAHAAAERLGRMACEETGYGVPEHKTLKNTVGLQSALGRDQGDPHRGRRAPRRAKSSTTSPGRWAWSPR
jgi:hypothetical protein